MLPRCDFTNLHCSPSRWFKFTHFSCFGVCSSSGFGLFSDVHGLGFVNVDNHVGICFRSLWYRRHSVSDHLGVCINQSRIVRISKGMDFCPTEVDTFMWVGVMFFKYNSCSSNARMKYRGEVMSPCTTLSLLEKKVTWLSCRWCSLPSWLRDCQYCSEHESGFNGGVGFCRALSRYLWLTEWNAAE